MAKSKLVLIVNLHAFIPNVKIDFATSHLSGVLLACFTCSWREA